MKIAQITPVFPPYTGGIGKTAYYYSYELTRLGHEVTVFTPKEKKESFDFKVEYLTPWLKYGKGSFLPQLFFKLKCFDLIHLHYPFFGGAEVVYITKLLRKKTTLVITYHMDLVGQGLMKKYFQFYTKYFLPRLVKISDKILFSSFDYLENSFLKDFSREKFSVIPLGVDLKRFFKQKKKEELLKKYNLLGKIVFFVGGLDQAHYFKGVECLIKAFSSLNAQLIIAGQGNLKEYYFGLVKKLGLEKRINFVGFIQDKDLPFYYNLADLFVLPSIDRSEAFGLVLLEAMACAKPVIASNLPGVRSLVKKNGLLVKPGDAKDLAEKIKRMLDSSRLDSFGEKSREEAEKYSWPLIVKELEKMYFTLCSKN